MNLEISAIKSSIQNNVSTSRKVIEIFERKKFSNKFSSFAVIGDKENMKTKKRAEKKKKLYNPLDDDVIFSPDEQNSDRDIFREVSQIEADYLNFAIIECSKLIAKREGIDGRINLRLAYWFLEQ